MALQSDTKFNLFSNCIPVKGAMRSTICDLQNNKYYLIPNGLYDVLTKFNGKTISEVKAEFDPDDDRILDEYFNFLADNELIFFDDDTERFPPLSMDWDEPNTITNAIIDRDDNSNYDLKKVFQALEELQCQHIQIRHYSEIKIEEIEQTMSLLDKSYIAFVEWVIPFTKSFDEDNSFFELRELTKKYPRIFTVTFYNYSKTGTIFQSLLGFGNIYSTTQNIHSHLCCGNINENLFHINIRTFTESKKFNTCLNRKLGIDINGEIKNCPSMQVSYGNIANASIVNTINTAEFKEIWHIDKEDISVCKSCEFRHICTDCRAFIENPIDKYSKPLKCGYDPNACTWTDWSQNKLKNDAIEYYKISNF